MKGIYLKCGVDRRYTNGIDYNFEGYYDFIALQSPFKSKTLRTDSSEWINLYDFIDKELKDFALIEKVTVEFLEVPIIAKFARWHLIIGNEEVPYQSVFEHNPATISGLDQKEEFYIWPEVDYLKPDPDNLDLYYAVPKIYHQGVWKDAEAKIYHNGVLHNATPVIYHKGSV